VVAVVAVAWRWECVGILVFAGLGLFYNIAAHNQALVAHLAISEPLYLIAALFLLNWLRPDRPMQDSVKNTTPRSS
jgi:hypothetical protein